MAAVFNKPPETVYRGLENRLSRNAQSSAIHTPLQLDRITTNPQAYKTFLQDGPDDHILRKPSWGVNRNASGLCSNQQTSVNSYGGQPAKIPSHLDKNHMHFGSSGFSYPRVSAIKPQYDLTHLKKSSARATDELIAHIKTSLTGDPPYSSHTSRLAVFPKIDFYTDKTHGGQHRQAWGVQDNTAIPGCDHRVVSGKIRGTPYRREVMQISEASNEKPDKSKFYDEAQSTKVGFTSEIQPYHGFQSAFAGQNLPDQSANLTVSQNTANTLQKLHTHYNTPEYTHSYSGNTAQNGTTFTNLASVYTGMDEQTERCEDVAMRDVHNREAVRAIESERPYTSTYKADFLTEPLPRRYTRPVSIKEDVRGNSSVYKIPSATNKSVKFRDQVTISDGHQTSSALVNDFSTHHKMATQLKETCSDDGARPSTAPLILKNKFSRNEVSCYPITTNATYTSSGALLQRPHTTGQISLSRQLGQLQNSYSKTDVHRKFHREFPEKAPDIRRKPDMRITTNERRHVIPEVGCHSYYFHG